MGLIRKKGGRTRLEGHSESRWGVDERLLGDETRMTVLLPNTETEKQKKAIIEKLNTHCPTTEEEK